MNIVKQLGGSAARMYGQSKSVRDWVRVTDKALLLPFYHMVSDTTPDYLNGLYAIRSVDLFKRDLDFYQKHFKSIPMDDVISNKYNSEEAVFHLSFDDGLREMYDVVAPILEERNIHATFFINTDFIDNQDMLYRFKAAILARNNIGKKPLSLNWVEKNKLNQWASDAGISFADFLEEHQPYMTEAQIADLSMRGFSIGAHSRNHPRYHLIPLGDQIEQTESSLNIVKSISDESRNFFSFPFTDFGVKNEFFEKTKGLIDMSFGSAGIKDDSARNHLQRLPMEIEGSAEEIVKSAYAYYYLLKKIGKEKILR